MENKMGQLKHQQITDRVIGAFYDVYNELGFGFLESVYENALVLALGEAGLRTKQQAPIPVYFHGQQVGDFRCDILVEDCVILELKSVKQISAEHEAQTLNYLRATDVEVALILNFGEHPDIKRRVFDNDRKRSRG